jgi:hypothetical protein
VEEPAIERVQKRLAVCWVVVDAVGALPRQIALQIDIVARPLAVLFGGAAALAQLWTKRELRSGLG